MLDFVGSWPYIRFIKPTNWFTYNNVNPKNKINGDCVIRAIANAMNKTWDEVNEDSFKYSVKYKTVLNDKHTYEKYLKDNPNFSHFFTD